MKLTQLLSNKFKNVHLNIQQKKYFKELDQYVEHMFPLNDESDRNVDNILYGDNEKRIENMDNNLLYVLPVHIRDNQWLAQYVDVCYHYLSTDLSARKVKFKEIPFDAIQNYVAMAPKFEKYRDLYEKQVMKACIVFCQNNEDDASFFDSVMFDDFFRSKVITMIMKLGIDRNTAEICLEQNAHLWRRNAMFRTFTNQLKCLNPNYINDDKRELLHSYDPMTWEHFVSKELKYMSLWMRQRERDYEQRHDSVIKQAGLTPNIQLDIFDSRILDLDVKNAKKEYQETLSLVNEEIQDIEDCGLDLSL